VIVQEYPLSFVGGDQELSTIPILRIASRNAFNLSVEAPNGIGSVVVPFLSRYKLLAI